MFCPSCGELAVIREGDGKTYYERIESSINPEREEYENDKPKEEDYYSGKFTSRLRKPILKPEYKKDYQDWKALDYLIPRFKNENMGEEIEKKGVKYSTCHNPYCKYNGPAAKVKKDGKEIDFEDFNSKSEVENRDYTPIIESEGFPGVLTRGTYICPRCDCTEVYADVNSNLEFGETAAKMLTCSECGHGWREF